MITLKQVEAFYWASVLGTFEAAAEKLNTAQSTISKRIQELELQSRVILFDRTKRTVRLTLKGQELLARAEEMLASRNSMMLALRNAEAFTGRFCFGVTELIAVTWLPMLITRINDKYPNLDLIFEVDNALRLFERLRDCQIDLAIAPSAMPQLDLETFPLPSMELAWMCSPSLGITKTELSFEEISRYPLLTQPASSAMQLVVAQLLAEQQVKMKQVISCNSMVALAELAAAGRGITCLPLQYYKPELAAGVLQQVVTSPSVPDLAYSVFRRRENADISADIAAMANDICDFGRPKR